MRKRTVFILVLTALALVSVLCLFILAGRQTPIPMDRKIDKKQMAAAMKDGEIAAIWYDTQSQLLYGVYSFSGKSLRDLPDSADFYLHVDAAQFWESAQRLAKGHSGMMMEADNIAFGRMADQQSFWLRFRGYAIGSVVLLLLVILFVLWLAWKRRHIRSASSSQH